MTPKTTFAILAALALAAGPLLAQDVGQLNWRVTDLERRLALAEQANANLANQLTTTSGRLNALEAKFGSLVTILDQKMREDQTERQRLKDEELRKAAAAKGSAPAKAEK